MLFPLFHLRVADSDHVFKGGKPFLGKETRIYLRVSHNIFFAARRPPSACFCRKILCKAGHLPKYDDQSLRAWLTGKIFVALLIEKIIQLGDDFFPLGTKACHHVVIGENLTSLPECQNWQCCHL